MREDGKIFSRNDNNEMVQIIILKILYLILS
jgi:hypothetical protein